MQAAVSGQYFRENISIVNENMFVKFGKLIYIGHTTVTIAQYSPPLIILTRSSATAEEPCDALRQLKCGRF